MMNRWRVLLADDSAEIREVLRDLLKEQFDVIGCVEDGRSAVEAAAELKPDVVLLDIYMPGLNGIEAARQIHSLNKSIRLVFVTQYREKYYVDAAFQAGAMGYVVKQRVVAELRRTMEEVLAGRVYTHLRSV